MKDYSQNQEQQFILDYFKNHPPGFFWDIGAGDGVCNSNTRALWELGWNGVLFEPSPAAFEILLTNYQHRKETTVLVNCAVVPAPCASSMAGLKHITECEIQGWSSLDAAWIGSWKGKQTRLTQVLCLGIDYLAKILPEPDFLSIDTEGLDASILESLPLDFHPGLVMAETDKLGAQERVDAAMLKHGFSIAWKGRSNAAYEYRQT